MCFICGQPLTVRCNCISSQPFCDQCDPNTTCAEQVDQACVIYHLGNPDQPSRLTNLGMPNGSSAEQIFERIDMLVGSAFNLPINVVDTATVDLTASGPANHTLQADVKVSVVAGNIMQVKTDGLYVPDSPNAFKVKVTPSTLPLYLEDALLGGSDGIVSIGFTASGNNLFAEPTISIAALLQAIDDDPSLVDLFCNLVDGCIPSGDPAVTVTADNGLTKTLDNIQLGGDLIKNTTVSDFDFNLLFLTNTVQIGNLSNLTFTQPAGYANDEGLKFQVSEDTHFMGTGSPVATILGRFFLEDAGDVNASSNAHYSLTVGMYAFIEDSITFTKDTQNAAFGTGLGLGGDNNMTADFGNPIAGVRSLIVLFPGSAVGQPDSVTPGTFVDAAAFYAAIPTKNSGGDSLANLSTITNYYGIYLDDPGLGSVDTKITNKFGIYQVGSVPVNRFFGPVQNSVGAVQFTSDVRIKENIVPYVYGLSEIEKLDVVKFDLAAIAGGKKDVVGLIAQQVENILPSAVATADYGKEYGISDLKMIKESQLIYTLINAVKELSAKIAALEARSL